MPDTTQEFTADDALQIRFNAYDEEFGEIDTRLRNLESFIRGNNKLCPPDGDNTFCDPEGAQSGGKRKKRRRKSRKKKRKTNKKKRKRKRKTKRKRRR